MKLRMRPVFTAIVPIPKFGGKGGTIMQIRSNINQLLTLEYMQNEEENKYFDRKAAKVRPSDLASTISAFANAGGGTIVIGIDEKSRLLEGVDTLGSKHINDLVNAPRDCCMPMPRFKEELLAITNDKEQPDHLLLLHIQESVDQVVRTSQNRTFLRIGDRTKELLGEDLRNLEYTKSTRHFEDEVNRDAAMEDIDAGLLAEYKARIGAENVSDEQLLRARGFLKKEDGKEYLSNAAVLLFARNISQFYPNCRVRFLRYEGVSAQVGTAINLVRDTSIEFPLLRIIDEAKNFIGAQLREFTMLDGDGKFRIVPEYPEFAWLEGVVNAVAHREYALSGSFIKVSMFDDRLEIESPGKLPNIVTLENIKETRYSRNPRIARVLTEFGWVRELNEGVKRIFSDMEKFFLDAPAYSEQEQALKLVLKNNIVIRKMRQDIHVTQSINKEKWEQLDEIERAIFSYLVNHGESNRATLSRYVGKSGTTVNNRLKHLMDLGLVEPNGKAFDPTRTYKAISV